MYINDLSCGLSSTTKLFADDASLFSVVHDVAQSTYVEVSAGVPQRPTLCPLFFLMYINDLSCGLSSTTKLFADDTSLFSVVHDVTQSTNELNDDLEGLPMENVL